MTLEKSDMKKMCSFCVSNWHMATIILPYVKEKVENNEKVISIVENDLENYMMELVERAKINNIIKSKIIGIDWKKSVWNKYEQFEYFMEEHYNKSINIIINGTHGYIERINEYIDKWYLKNKTRITEKGEKVRVINCYNIFDGFKSESIKTKYKYILNTTGVKNVSDYFNEKMKIAN